MIIKIDDEITKESMLFIKNCDSLLRLMKNTLDGMKNEQIQKVISILWQIAERDTFYQYPQEF